MKALFVFVYIIATGLALPSYDLDPSWQQYKSTHKKIYKTNEEEQKRYELFSQKLREIKEHNAKYEEGLTTYKKGINRFSDWTLEEVSTFLNGNGMEKSHQDKHEVFNAPKGVKLPDTVDWRTKGAVTNVEDQGDCKASWAFSAAGALEGVLNIARNETVSLSEQNLLDCVHPGANVCATDSIDVDGAFKYVVTTGIESASDYPYLGESAHCDFDIYKSILAIKGQVYVAENDEDALQAAVAEQPVSVVIDARPDFLDYDSGIFSGKYCRRVKQYLNHAALAVGYGTENGTDYWIIKNSWGTGWGEQGYIRMIRNYRNRCGVATSASYPFGVRMTRSRS